MVASKPKSYTHSKPRKCRQTRGMRTGKLVVSSAREGVLIIGAQRRRGRGRRRRRKLLAHERLRTEVHALRVGRSCVEVARGAVIAREPTSVGIRVACSREGPQAGVRYGGDVAREHKRGAALDFALGAGVRAATGAAGGAGPGGDVAEVARGIRG